MGNQKKTSLFMFLIMLMCCITFCACDHLDNPIISITVKELPKVSYVIGEEFTSTNIVVEKGYKDGTSGNIEIEDLVITPPDMTTTGKKDVSVKATIDGKEFETSYEITISSLVGSISFSASYNPSMDYTGVRVADPSVSDYVKTGSGTVTIKWFNENDLTTPISAPVNVGSYRVVLELAPTNDYTVATATKSFTVNKATPSYTTPTDLTAEYGQTLSDILLPAGFTWTTPNTNVGSIGNNTFTLTFTPEDTNNYKTMLDIEVTVSVTKITQVVSNISDISKGYDCLAVSAPTYVKLGDGEVTIMYYSVSGGSNTLLESAPLDIGSYVVRVSVAEGTYHKAGYGERAFTINSTQATIIDHTYAKNSSLSSSIANTWDLTNEDIAEINRELKIAYFHTSHGNQIIEGMNLISAYLNTNYILNNVNIYDNYNEGGSSFYKDAGNSAVYETTKEYIQNNPTTNVVIWAWCGQLCWMSEAQVDVYLNNMSRLESEYQDIKFVYMTGHTFNSVHNLSGDTENGNVVGTLAINTANNARIRNYCVSHGRILFDFEEIESYDPDGQCYTSGEVRDDCYYKIDGSYTGNWVIEWAQKEYDADPTTFSLEKRDLLAYNGCSHTFNLNAICKAYAFWNLLHLLCA